MITTALMCMALNIYHEARGEPVKGQFAVAHVTWNRAKKEAKNVCPEVTKPYQFSWTIDKTKKVKGGYRLLPSAVPKDKFSWNVAVKIAELVMANKVPDFTKGALFYHEVSVKPRWRKAFKLVATIGNHHFYTLA